ncbi:MAG: NAD(P)/FAD-dependent oxidoreductase [Phycisphaeraceae bacterium]|nr:NAD(P)/FAD-dependent oxidoreductase [Phycisphaeraceae bacterium]
MVDKQNHHLFQPLLYQVAMAGLSATEIAEPIRTIFRGRRNIASIMDAVESIDLDNKTAQSALGVTVGWDYLVVAIGGRTSYFGNDHWAEHAPGIKTLEDAMRVRRTVLTSFELAEAIDDPDERRKLTTIVVVGGGATGVELAGAMAELSTIVFKKDFRRIDPTEARVVLIDGGGRLLSPFPEKLSASAKRQLEGLGVEVILNTRVQDIHADGVLLNNGETIETHNVLWGGGVQAPELTQALGVELGAGGRVVVGPDLSIPGHPEAYVIGDVADCTLPDGTKAPGLAPSAMQMGKHVAKLVSAELKQGKTPPDQREAFTYWDKGTMATIGRTHAIADIGPLHFGGIFAWLAWLVVHLMLLVGFRNKLVVLIQWFYSYVTFRRGARIIIGEADHRDAVEAVVDAGSQKSNEQTASAEN